MEKGVERGEGGGEGGGEEIRTGAIFGLPGDGKIRFPPPPPSPPRPREDRVDR